MATASPFIRALRNLLAGGSRQLQLRYAEDMTTRSPPPANLPGGISHKLSDNYYLTRDGRRLMAPPEVVYGQTKLIAEGESTEEAAPQKNKRPPIPPGGGLSYTWKEMPPLQ
ncbi:NDUFA7 [Branchiostoma lanceolatum]|uniref:NADH dehydrogenase [ubiquinone] 1 alpha subcomplex subunit 7 n=1 Tax=Branchiostoma lanceolatum TaxID=7740 RepID=A0A8J9YWI9_BRALA|nr:NDUFA7 [Branchiostoma lanceolatum]